MFNTKFFSVFLVTLVLNVVPSHSECIIEYDTDYTGSPIGNDLENVPSSSAFNCCSQCSSQAVDKCAAWTYSSGTCYFKSSSGVKVSSIGSKFC